MKILPVLTLDMIPIQIKLYKALKTPFKLFLVKRSTEDRVGYSIAYKDVLEGSNDIICTTYIWTNKQKALLKVIELIEPEESVSFVIE